MYEVSHKARFEKYRDETTILKVTQYAKWTLPQLMADLLLAQNGTPLVIERDYQEVGALLTNNLAAKLASILFPTNRPFYRIRTSQALKDMAEQAGLTESTLAAQLARMEMDSCQRLFINASYNQLVLALKHLIVTGNTMLYRNPKTYRMAAYGLQSFSCVRDGEGRVLDAVLRQYTQFAGLTKELQQALRAKHPHRYNSEAQLTNTCELYTRIERQQRPGGDVFEITQEIDGVMVDYSETFPELLCPYQIVSWSLIAGEHYGRGLVEDYAGGFAKLSDMSQALALYEISSMKVVNLVAPGSGTDIDVLESSETGEYVQGNPDAIKALESGDSNKIEVMRAELQDVFTNLSRAFMWTGNTRDAERVTAYELRQLATEAEVTLGGNYSVLSEAMQVPLAHILLGELEPDTKAGFISGDMKLDIMAGIPALGRSSDVQNILGAAQEAAAIIPALTQLSKKVDGDKLLDLIMAGSSVDTTQFYKSETQTKQETAGQEQVSDGMAQIGDAQAIASAADQLQQLQ